MYKIIIKYILKFLIPIAFDSIVESLGKLAAKSDNNIDDRIVGIIKANKKLIIKEIKSL